MNVCDNIQKIRLETDCSMMNMFDRRKIKLFKDDAFCKYKHQLYHYKVRNLHSVVNELVGEIISEYFELDSVKSEIFREGSFMLEYILLTKLFDIKGYDLINFSTDYFPNIKNSNKYYLSESFALACEQKSS